MNAIHQPNLQTVMGLLQSNRAAEAEVAARQLLSRTPEDVHAMFALAVALLNLGRPAESAELHRRLIELQPSASTHYNNLATALWDMGDLEGADAAYRQGLARNPSDAGALASLGALRWQLGDAVETRELMLAAWRIDPGLPEPRIYGAPACLKCADTDMAERLLEKCEEWPFLGPKLEADLGATLMQVDRPQEAERRLRALMKYPEAESIATLRLAALMERINRLDEAEALLSTATISPMDRGEEQALRATLASRRGRFDEAIPLYRNSLDSRPVDINSADALFALAKAYDGTGDTVLAMETLRRAHEVQLAHAGRLLPGLLDPNSNPLNIVDFPVSEAEYREWKAEPNAPTAEQSPIFIVGFPRSGTTLLEQMLDAHPGLRSMDERAFLQNVITKMQEGNKRKYPDDLGSLGAGDLQELREVYWTCVKSVLELQPGERLVDKNPLNILRLPIIHRMFPNARIILALRHPGDVLLSNYMQCFYAPTYQILCSSFERLARGYANAMDFWTAHANLFEARILELRYEDLLDNPAAEIDRLVEHLGLSDPAALHGFREHARNKGFIATPSYSQVVEPLTKKAVGRWQRYREQLDPVLPVLKSAMERWGYSAD
jgi:tetratricopeptide (TPR) repeat protein